MDFKVIQTGAWSLAPVFPRTRLLTPPETNREARPGSQQQIVQQHPLVGFPTAPEVDPEHSKRSGRHRLRIEATRDRRLYPRLLSSLCPTANLQTSPFRHCFIAMHCRQTPTPSNRLLQSRVGSMPAVRAFLDCFSPPRTAREWLCGKEECADSCQGSQRQMRISLRLESQAFLAGHWAQAAVEGKMLAQLVRVVALRLIAWHPRCHARVPESPRKPIHHAQC